MWMGSSPSCTLCHAQNSVKQTCKHNVLFKMSWGMRYQCQHRLRPESIGRTAYLKWLIHSCMLMVNMYVICKCDTLSTFQCDFRLIFFYYSVLVVLYDYGSHLWSCYKALKVLVCLHEESRCVTVLTEF